MTYLSIFDTAISCRSQSGSNSLANFIDSDVVNSTEDGITCKTTYLQQKKKNELNPTIDFNFDHSWFNCFLETSPNSKNIIRLINFFTVAFKRT